ncbi:MAG TPA: FADH(2)-oxidizing methylenetetrahydrofolate--tRNA-(uracil(54)-C(5))-methyltransferase TrmFO, partial [Caulobacteraceae bacterium]
SAAIGLIAGRLAAAECRDRRPEAPPPTTALGALLTHITSGHRGGVFQPMNVNYGLFPPIDTPSRQPGAPRARGDRARAKRRALAERALRDLEVWLAGPAPAAARYSAA